MALMKLMALFEAKTRVRPKDAFEDENKLLYFVVDKGMISKAVGKQGVNAKKITSLINRKIKIVEFDPNRETFIKRLVFPLKVTEVSYNGDVVSVKGQDIETNSRIIGRNASNLRNYEKIVKRYFSLDEIKVI